MKMCRFLGSAFWIGICRGWAKSQLFQKKKSSVGDSYMQSDLETIHVNLNRSSNFRCFKMQIPRLGVLGGAPTSAFSQAPQMLLIQVGLQLSSSLWMFSFSFWLTLAEMYKHCVALWLNVWPQAKKAIRTGNRLSGALCASLCGL